MMKFKSLFLAAVLVSMTAIAAMAQDAPAAKPGITPYASLRYFMGANYLNNYAGGESDSKDLDMKFNQVLNSRAGLAFKGDKLGGRVEAGIKENSSGNAITLRHFFITYKAGDVDILLGQTDPAFVFVSTVDGIGWNGSGYGNAWFARVPQIKISYQGLYLNLIQPTASVGPGAGGVVDYTAEEAAQKYDVYYPMTGIGYDMKNDTMTIGANFTGYKFSPQATSLKDNDYLVYIAALHGHIKLDPAYVRFNAYYSLNPNRMGIDGTSAIGGQGTDKQTSVNAIAQDFNANAGEDNAVVGGYLELGSKIGTGTLSVMCGYVQNLDTDANRMAIAGQFSYPIESYLKLMPTVVYFDDLDGYSAALDKTYEQGKELYAGLMVQADI